jgi:hypothetical protein
MYGNGGKAPRLSNQLLVHALLSSLDSTVKRVYPCRESNLSSIPDLDNLLTGISSTTNK